MFVLVKTTNIKKRVHEIRWNQATSTGEAAGKTYDLRLCDCKPPQRFCKLRDSQRYRNA